MRGRKWITTASLGVATLLVVSACSSSGTKSTGGSSPTSAPPAQTSSAPSGANSSVAPSSPPTSSPVSSPTQQSSGAAAGSPSSTASGLAQLAALVQQYQVRPTTIPESALLPAKPPTGKVIDWVECPLPDCTNLAVFAKQAAAHFGWTIREVNAGLTPATIKNAWDKVVADKPDGVFAEGEQRVLFNPELEKVKAMGIPYVELAESDPVSDGISAAVISEDSFAELGKITAWAMLAKYGASMHALSVHIAGFKDSGNTSIALDAEVTAKCAGCQLDTLTFNATQLGSPAVPNGVIAYLKGHPGIDAVYAPFPSVIQQVLPQVKSAGLSNVGLFTGVEGDIAADIQNGTIQAAVASPWVEWIYMVIDAFARLFTHQPVPAPQAGSQVPFWLLNSSNIPPEASKPYFPIVTNYDAQFTKLWGVS
jgi:ABC-type sugar transport system substrate-binding protein